MAQSRRNEWIKNQIDELKSLDSKNGGLVIFNLDSTTFNEEEMNTEPKEYVISGRIFPNSEIYNQGAYQIEIKLPSAYPLNPPKVRFLTAIHHPNVDKNGK
jgi:ubiquitin-protein ligase